MEKPSWKIQLLMIFAALSSWPLALVFCYMFDDVVDEKKKSSLAILKKYSISIMRFEILIIALYLILAIISVACGLDINELISTIIVRI